MERQIYSDLFYILAKLIPLIFSELCKKDSFFYLDRYLLKKFLDICSIKINHTMNAIINVKKGSAYAHLNGHTFKITALYNTSVDLAITNKIGMVITTFFGFEEIIICDLQNEMQSAYDRYNWDGNTTYLHFLTYCAVKNYQVDVKYNCPA